MTDAQTSAPESIKEIMREHFESAVFVCEGEGSEDHAEQLTYCTSGKWSSALGLIRYCENELLKDEEPSFG